MYKHLSSIFTILVCLVLVIIIHFSSEFFLKSKLKNDEFATCVYMKQQFGKAEILLALGREKDAQDILIELAVTPYTVRTEYPALALMRLAVKPDGSYDREMLKMVIERFPDSVTAKRAKSQLKTEE